MKFNNDVYMKLYHPEPAAEDMPDASGGGVVDPQPKDEPKEPPKDEPKQSDTNINLNVTVAGAEAGKDPEPEPETTPEDPAGEAEVQ